VDYTRHTFIGLLLLSLVGISVPIVMAAFIEGATRKQCLTHDWSPELHRNHMEFCEVYGYPTSSVL